MPRYAVTVTYGNRDRCIQQIFSDLQKKRAKPRSNFITTTFRKLLFLTQYRSRYAIYTPLNANDVAIELTMVAYGNWQNATKFAQANNSDLLRALKPGLTAKTENTRAGNKWVTFG